MRCTEMWQVQGAIYKYGAAFEFHAVNLANETVGLLDADNAIETKPQVDPSGNCPCVFGGRRFFCLISQPLSKAAWQEQRRLPVSDVKFGEQTCPAFFQSPVFLFKNIIG